MRLLQLKQKEIINICNCKSLGCPVDIEFDPCTGQIKQLIVPIPGKFHGCFGKEGEYCIPWECITQIGEDIILVKVQEEKCLRKV